MTKTPIQFGDLSGTAPIDAYWGHLRGTPIDRFYVEAFLDRRRADIAGRVLEAADARYSTRFGGDRVTRQDVLNLHAGNPNATIVGDLSISGLLPQNAFDCIVLTQVLQFIYDLPTAIAQLHAALKPGGVLLATAPGISQIEPSGADGTCYWALTPASASRLFVDAFGAESVSIETHGNVFAAVCYLHGLAAEELPPENLMIDDPSYPVTLAIRARRLP
jgi:SAM-dependent methyltransferase